MKKLLVLIAVCSMASTSCHRKHSKEAGTPQNQQQAQTDSAYGCQMTEEQKAMIQDWENWDNLDDARKTELLDKGKECYDRYKQKEVQREADKAKFEAQMANWDKLSIEEKKAAFDLITPQRYHHGNEHCKGHNGQQESESHGQYGHGHCQNKSGCHHQN